MNNSQSFSQETESLETTDRIIEGAMKVFARGPVDTVSLRMIAAEAGVKLPLIMYHFKSKANLYQAVFDRAMSFLEKNIRPYQDMLEEKKTLTKEQAGGIFCMLINSVMDGLYNDPPPTCWPERILMIEMLYPSEFHDLFYEKYFKKRYDFLAALITALTGKEDREATILQASMIYGQIFSFRLMREILIRFSGAAGFSREETETMKVLVLRNSFLILESDLANKYFDEPRIFDPIETRDPTAPSSLNAGLLSDADFPEPDYSITSVKHIIDAATRLFSRQTVDTVSLNIIAKEAKVKVPLLMYHFKSKANLYRIVLERIISLHQQRTLDCTDRIRQRKNGSAKENREFVRELFAQIMKGIYDPDRPLESRENMLIYEALYPSTFYERFYDRYYRKRFELLVEIVKSVTGVKNGPWVHWQALAVFGLMVGFRLERETLVRSIGMAGFNAEEMKKITTMAADSALLLLEADKTGFS